MLNHLVSLRVGWLNDQVARIQLSAEDLSSWWSQHSALQASNAWSSATLHMALLCSPTSSGLLPRILPSRAISSVLVLDMYSTRVICCHSHNSIYRCLVIVLLVRTGIGIYTVTLCVSSLWLSRSSLEACVLCAMVSASTTPLW